MPSPSPAHQWGEVRKKLPRAAHMPHIRRTHDTMQAHCRQMQGIVRAGAVNSLPRADRIFKHIRRHNNEFDPCQSRKIPAFFGIPGRNRTLPKKSNLAPTHDSISEHADPIRNFHQTGRLSPPPVHQSPGSSRDRPQRRQGPSQQRPDAGRGVAKIAQQSDDAQAPDDTTKALNAPTPAKRPYTGSQDGSTSTPARRPASRRSPWLNARARARRHADRTSARPQPQRRRHPHPAGGNAVNHFTISPYHDGPFDQSFDKVLHR